MDCKGMRTCCGKVQQLELEVESLTKELDMMYYRRTRPSDDFQSKLKRLKVSSKEQRVCSEVGEQEPGETGETSDQGTVTVPRRLEREKGFTLAKIREPSSQERRALERQRTERERRNRRAQDRLERRKREHVKKAEEETMVNLEDAYNEIEKLQRSSVVRKEEIHKLDNLLKQEKAFSEGCMLSLGAFIARIGRRLRKRERWRRRCA